METGDLFDDKGRPIRIIESPDLALVKMLLDTPLSRLSIDSTNRLRVYFDNIPAGGVFPIDQRYEMQQRADIEFAGCQRRLFTFS